MSFPIDAKFKENETLTFPHKLRFRRRSKERKTRAEVDVFYNFFYFPRTFTSVPITGQTLKVPESFPFLLRNRSAPHSQNKRSTPAKNEKVKFFIAIQFDFIIRFYNVPFKRTMKYSEWNTIL